MIEETRWTAARMPQPPDMPYPSEPSDWEALWCEPVVDKTAWVSPGAVLIGRVVLKRGSSVWYGCVLRGDESFIEVGEESNIQDCSVLHVEPDTPCIIGDHVTLGHRVTVHASQVEDWAMVGIGATVLSGSVVGSGAIVAAGALVLEGTKVPPETLWAGVPAREIRKVTPELRERVISTNRQYANRAAMYLHREKLLAKGRGQQGSHQHSDNILL
ncbi:MAG: gamma carbonic anhydrase family protein [Methanothrix sp.]|jgi:carbonic anhydrase/acetyltransferase-like protein (isoleucine patch superfamily)|uniref:gamma carbonic anhydrase family protein n=1 Tax=Methanothrix sp. TaxID=90426 RepID=UPI00247C2C78|nr:gamma carbonic anhydrase family protein [Methanothrix sp.]